MTWSTAINDLRNELSDNATDKLRYRKRCFDQCNGVNTNFKTFEFRRITNFVSSVDPEAVYVDGLAVTVTGDYPEIGEFIIDPPPQDGQIVECTYYIQWFLDSELTIFLTMAANWLGYAGDWTTIPSGLIPSALKYACADAYQKLALRWSEHLSETFRLEDSQDPKRMDIVSSYRQASLDYRKEAESLRNTFYQRQGRNLQPLFQTISGAVQEPTPKR